MRLVKVHKPSSKIRLLAYDNGDIVKIHLDFYANIEKEHYDYSAITSSDNIKVAKDFVEIGEDTGIKMMDITDDASFHIKCSGSTDGGAMDEVSYYVYE